MEKELTKKLIEKTFILYKTGAISLDEAVERIMGFLIDEEEIIKILSLIG